MVKNVISLYKKIDGPLLEQINLSDFQIQISYTDKLESITLRTDETRNDSFYINEHDPEWNPNLDNMVLSVSFTINNPSALFGTTGVTSLKNKIGIASKIHSKQSNFQEIKTHQIISSDISELSVKIDLTLLKGMLKGEFNLDLFFYIAEINERLPWQADQLGMIVSQGPIISFSFLVDGDGSDFPITEFQEPKGALWRFEKDWVAADEDIFEASNVRLALNTSHPLFEQIKNGKTRVSIKLMNDIITQFISLIVQQVILIEGFSIEDAENATDNSILRMVQYWVTTYNIDTSTIYSITNSINKNMQISMTTGEVK
ncbi:hypothetical protein HZY86_03300 [Aerococcaceae bacterium DSM 111020]|nr:hypothetical protein [Aerococcaceae bacterium DSM 111020]